MLYIVKFNQADLWLGVSVMRLMLILFLAITSTVTIAQSFCSIHRTIRYDTVTHSPAIPNVLVSRLITYTETLGFTFAMAGGWVL